MRPTRPEATHSVVGKRVAVHAGLAVLLLLLNSVPLAAAEPWRLDAAFAPSERLTLTASQRTRYSRLYNQFRPGLGTDDKALSLQTLLRAEVGLDRFVLVAELQDSRALLTDEDSAVTPGIVNAVEPIQTYLGYRWSGNSSTLNLGIGRQTMDIGNRRFVSRAGYRNAIQSFTGLTARWQDGGGGEFAALFVLPAVTEPADFDGLLDNRVEHDDYDSDFRFWGLYLRRPDLVPGTVVEAGLYGLRERDDPGERETRDRHLLTQTLRFSRPPGPGRWDFDFDNALQFGHRSATFSANDTQRLDVFAHFHHAEIGYTFDERWSPRVSFESDLASGDEDPGDGDFDRFDTLFGGGRSEFGPTDFYGLLGRENLRSVGLRLAVQPSERSSAFLSLRSNWLDARRDIFARTLVVDPAGQSGGFGGEQIEMRVRYWLVPDWMRWEFGAAMFLEGEFMRNAPNATGHGDPVFFYSDLMFTF